MNQNRINRRQFLRNSLKAAGTLAALHTFPGVTAGASDDLIIDTFRPEPTALVELLERAADKRAEFAEIFLEHVVTRQIHFVNGTTDVLKKRINQGLAIRGFTPTQTAFSACEGFREKDAKNTARAVRKQLKGNRHELSFRKLPRFPQQDFGAIITRKQLKATEDLQVMETLSSLINDNPVSSNLISRSEIMYTDEIRRIIVLNNTGTFIMDHQPSINLTFTQTATGKHREATVTRTLAHRCGFDLMENDSVITTMHETTAQAVEKLSARRISPGAVPVVLTPEAAAAVAQFWLNQHMTGNSPGQITSDDYADLSLIDNGRVQNGRGTSHCDDEGTLTSRTVLVSNGTARARLRRRTSGTSSRDTFTGNCRRRSFADLPVTAPTNTYIETGTNRPESLENTINRGLLVTDMTLKSMDHQHGTFDVKTGWWIERGKRVHPVSDMTIRETMPGLLNKIIATGEETVFVPGTFGVNEIQVSYGAPGIALKDINFS